jgi:hypothetical protein
MLVIPKVPSKIQDALFSDGGLGGGDRQNEEVATAKVNLHLFEYCHTKPTYDSP